MGVVKYNEGDTLKSGIILLERLPDGKVKVEFKCGHVGILAKPPYFRLKGLCQTCSEKQPTTLVHGNSPRKGDSPTYSTWLSMRRRCNEPSNNRYYRYGERGIKVCDRWNNSFTNFLEDMGEKPEGTSLDRIDNDGNYTPENCKWSTRIEQNKTKSNTIKVVDEVTKEVYSLRNACEVVGVDYKRSWSQLKQQGKSIKEILGNNFTLMNA